MKVAERGGAPPGNKKGGPREEAAHTLDKTNITQCAEKFKSWKRTLALAFDGVLEAESGDLSLIERNLVESATEMLRVAGEIRRQLRQ
jgi:hypothetical protein